MLTLDGIVARLQDRQLGRVREATLLSKPTIMNIRDGKNTNPGYATLKVLSDYLEGLDSKAKEADASSA